MPCRAKLSATASAKNTVDSGSHLSVGPCVTRLINAEKKRITYADITRLGDFWIAMPCHS